MFKLITQQLIGISCVALSLYILMYCTLLKEEFANNVNELEEVYRRRIVLDNSTVAIFGVGDVITNIIRIDKVTGEISKSVSGKGTLKPARKASRFEPIRNESIPEQMACKIPVLDPFNEEFMEIVNTFNPEPGPLCEPDTKFMTDYDSNLVKIEGNEEYFSQANCCYFKFQRGMDDMNIEKFENPCFPLTENKTKIPPEHEFIAVKCKGEDEREENMGYFGFIRLKPEVETRASKQQTSNLDQLSVVILGLDSVSQMNFQRYMTETRKYLQDTLSAIEFLGRNKVHESTFANVGPILTGWTNDELTSVVKCWKNPPQSHFDDCPFIWKDLEKIGYRTVYGEDSIHRSIYLDSTLNGFKKAIADYDFRTLIRGMEVMDVHDGCFNHQSSPEVLLNSIAKAAVTFRDKLYFHFTWITSFTHESAQATKYVDEPVVNLLKMLNEQNLLNNTAFILVSDHGMTFGEYVQTEQGVLESRMPMLNVILPEWFRVKYSRAIENLKTNAQRLSTPFDLHEMLNDLLNPSESISNAALKRREPEFYSKNRGISLFLPIPLNRTCAQAGIDDHWCICWDKKPIANPQDNFDVLKAVYFCLDILNAKLQPFEKCDELKVIKIISGRELRAVSTEITNFTNKAERRYEVVFQVSPSFGIFQGTVVLQKYRNPKIGGPISRINAYKHQGDCIDSAVNGTLEIKSMCFCSED